MKTTLLFLSISLLLSFQANAQNTTELFNGKDLSGWELVINDGDVCPYDVFTVKDGVIHITGSPFGFMQTEEEYELFHLYLEWRWPETPSNSGIFLFVQDEKKVWSNAVEVQLHAGDAGDFVLLAGSDLAEYVTPEGEERPAFPIIRKKDKSSENPVGEWNNAEIMCINGTITVFINGVYQNHATGSLHKKGRIALQSEGKAIEFRHVRLTSF